ncbi:hypothetical protein [Virgibacillus siamensis]|uniref:hypothetical protein n=1 Tax=Virgibacillus siamensis TaxID=480071 RepID=UPI0009852A17|nr:hypothetical protein [Virgibacillus siamensis]
MKKYFVFIVNFIVLYGLFQIVSGLVLTSLYNPMIGTHQETDFGKSFIPFLSMLLIATLSYLVSQKIGRNVFQNDTEPHPDK